MGELPLLVLLLHNIHANMFASRETRQIDTSAGVYTECLQKMPSGNWYHEQLFGRALQWTIGVEEDKFQSSPFVLFPFSPCICIIVSKTEHVLNRFFKTVKVRHKAMT